MITLVTILVAFLGYFSWTVYQDFTNKSDEEPVKKLAEETINENEMEEGTEQQETTVQQPMNAFGEFIQKEDLNFKRINRYIHYMSH